MEDLTTAMILAAGYGTRLKPMTDFTPKALLKIDGKPLLEHVIHKLVSEGIKKIVINTHYLSGMIEEYLMSNKFDAEINVSHEPEILGTGGGIKNAMPYLLSDKFFLVYNVDVISNVNISEMFRFHIMKNSLVTLAIQNRETLRPLLFDSRGLLVGRLRGGEELKYRDTSGQLFRTGFCGVHIVSNRIFDNFCESGFFDIFDTYFRLAKEGKLIYGYDIGESKWLDVGTLEDFNRTIRY